MTWREIKTGIVAVIVPISVLAAVAILIIVIFSKVLTVCVVSPSLSLLWVLLFINCNQGL